MSLDFAQMLGRPKKEVSDFITEMEEKYAYPGHDLRLLSEVGRAVSQKVTSLGLDPADTSSAELYHGLLAKFETDSQLVDKALGEGPDANFEQRLSRASEIVKTLIGGSEVWTLKHSAAKNFLSEYQPKKLTKMLGYRSIQSMLKRESTTKLYLLLAFSESKSWQENFAKKTAHLPSSDFNLQAVEVVKLPPAKVASLDEPTDLYICDKLTGSAAVWPSEQLSRAPIISLCLLLIQAIEKLGVAPPLKSLLNVHPALEWWTNMEHLISLHPDKPVSLNICDVANNRRDALEHHESSTMHGARALWSELGQRYQSLDGEIRRMTQTQSTNLMPDIMAVEH